VAAIAQNYGFITVDFKMVLCRRTAVSAAWLKNFVHRSLPITLGLEYDALWHDSRVDLGDKTTPRPGASAPKNASEVMQLFLGVEKLSVRQNSRR